MAKSRKLSPQSEHYVQLLSDYQKRRLKSAQNRVADGL
jgi:hypothetical protein